MRALAALAVVAPLVAAYKKGDVVNIMASHVGPVNNRECQSSVLRMQNGIRRCATSCYLPLTLTSHFALAASETYNFFVLPFCGSKHGDQGVDQDLGESLTGTCSSHR